MASISEVSLFWQRGQKSLPWSLLIVLLFLHGADGCRLLTTELDGPIRGDDAPVSRTVTRSSQTTQELTTTTKKPTTIHQYHNDCTGSSSSDNCNEEAAETNTASVNFNSGSTVYLPPEPEEITIFDWSEIFEETSVRQVCPKLGLCQERYPITSTNITDGSPKTSWNTSIAQSPNAMVDHNFLRTPCHCDSDCVRYGDCCQDAARTWWGSGPERESQYWECLPLRQPKEKELLELTSIYMISRCPPSRQSSDTFRLCEKDVDDTKYHYTLDVPVLSLETNRTYANIYCARCHDEVRLAMWAVEIICSNRQEITKLKLSDIMAEANYSRGLLQWTYTMYMDGPTSFQTIQCNAEILNFRSVYKYIQTSNARRCVPHKKRCAANWTNLADIRKCDMYSLLVQDGHSIVYKNPHCFRCDYGTTDALQCFNKNISQVPRTSTKPPVTPAFVLLFDFTPGAGGRLGLTRKCQTNEFWDDIHERCHPTTCGSLYDFVAGTCVRKPSPRFGGNNSTLIDSSCFRINLTRSEVIFLNDSIKVNSTQHEYRTGQYEVINGTIQVCAEKPDHDYYFKYSDAQNYLSAICMSVSIISLAAHIATHTALPKLRNLPGKNLLSLACALFMAQLLFLTGVNQTSYRGLCTFLGIAIHWFYLASFFWMNVMSFDICRTFTGGTHHFDKGRLSFRLYSLYAWGVPTFLIILCLILDFSPLLPDYAPNYGYNVCWISNKNGLIIFFIVPISFLLLENLILFGLTVHGIYQQRKAASYVTDKKQKHRNKRNSKSRESAEGKHPFGRNERKQTVRLILYVKLAIIMGLGWIFGFIAALLQVPGLWYPFILFNGLQGTFIFIAFDLKRKIFFMMWELVTGKPHAAATRTSSTQQSSASATRTISSGTTANTADMGRIDRSCPSSRDQKRTPPTDKTISVTERMGEKKTREPREHKKKRESPLHKNVPKKVEKQSSSSQQLKETRPAGNRQVPRPSAPLHRQRNVP